MKLLAIDCSTSFLSLAIDNGSRIFSFHEKVEQKHAERALPELARLLEQAELRLEQLDAIAFGQGPGSFTGLRIACGLAQGLAFSAGIPVIGIPTLDNVAQQAGAGTVLVCLDARMQQVYSACYRVAEGAAPERLDPISVGAPEAVLWPERVDIAAGDGFERYRSARQCRCRYCPRGSSAQRRRLLLHGAQRPLSPNSPARSGTAVRAQ
ncbi:tRNA (adenosine(37)-N6)-threonylcarbamoyltransferase complex dimerization subunit type 1 TsaB [Chromobacterium haemolyticum]|nr:tRNA (adenosine(37)-N6)-threonylcarbamoyltransferase complex dimerization subunit type 1 TsaB [Chromobacterium haemolyticum]